MAKDRIVQLKARFACSCGGTEVRIVKTKAAVDAGSCYCVSCKKLRGKYLGNGRFNLNEETYY